MEKVLAADARKQVALDQKTHRALLAIHERTRAEWAGRSYPVETVRRLIWEEVDRMELREELEAA